MKLSEELTQSSKVLASKGFTEEGKLLDKLSQSKLEFYVLVSSATDMETGVSVDRSNESVFMSKAKADEAIKVATCQSLRESDSYLYYFLEVANRNHKNHSSSSVADKASVIFGTQIEFTSEKFKLPKDATDEQLLEFTTYLGYAPFSLHKIKLEV